METLARVLLTHNVLDEGSIIRAVAASRAGAIDLFIGTVRDHNEGLSITQLEYHAYDSMAVAEMRKIVEELEREVPNTKLAVHHRLGSLHVGEIAVLCAASAPHRGEAFDGCRKLIDRIKARVPIWKREFGPDGPYWVGWKDARCHSHSDQSG